MNYSFKTRGFFLLQHSLCKDYDNFSIKKKQKSAFLILDDLGKFGVSNGASSPLPLKLLPINFKLYICKSPKYPKLNQNFAIL